MSRNKKYLKRKSSKWAKETSLAFTIIDLSSIHFTMNTNRAIEYGFFFALLALVGYLVWQIMSPFIMALILATIIVTISYPLYVRIKQYVPKQNESLASFITTLLVLLCFVVPISLLSTLVVKEVITFYEDISVSQLSAETSVFAPLESMVQTVIPSFQLDVTSYASSLGEFFIGNIGGLFSSTVSTVFLFALSLIGSFYLFRDGKKLIAWTIALSPLPNTEDEKIIARLATAIRAVATGTLLIAIIQGSLVGLGFFLFGIPRPILWGSVASLGALMPGIGTTIVTAPAIIYLFTTGQPTLAIGLLVWAIAIVGMVDNFLAPQLIGKRNNMHPFIILIAVLGGLSFFGPIGFIVGPVVVTLFFVLIELYNQYTKENM